MAFKKVITAATSSASASNKPGFKAKASKFNMLDFGKGILYEGNGKAVYTYCIGLNGTNVKNTKVIKDEEGTEYTKVDALVVLANALNSEKGMNCHLFEPRESEEKAIGSGNVRLDIKGVSKTINPSILQSLEELASIDAEEVFKTKQYLNVGRLFLYPGTATNSTFKARMIVFKSDFKTNEGFTCDKSDAIALLIAQLWSELVYTNVWNNSGDLAGSTSVKIDELLSSNVKELLAAIKGREVESEELVVIPREYELTEVEEEPAF